MFSFLIYIALALAHSADETSNTGPILQDSPMLKDALDGKGAQLTLPQQSEYGRKSTQPEKSEPELPYTQRELGNLPSGMGAEFRTESPENNDMTVISKESPESQQAASVTNSQPNSMSNLPIQPSEYGRKSTQPEKSEPELDNPPRRHGYLQGNVGAEFRTEGSKNNDMPEISEESPDSQQAQTDSNSQQADDESEEQCENEDSEEPNTNSLGKISPGYRRDEIETPVEPTDPKIRESPIEPRTVPNSDMSAAENPTFSSQADTVTQMEPSEQDMAPASGSVPPTESAPTDVKMSCGVCTNEQNPPVIPQASGEAPTTQPNSPSLTIPAMEPQREPTKTLCVITTVTVDNCKNKQHESLLSDDNYRLRT